MVNYREILRLQSLGQSQRKIEARVGSSRHTINEVLLIAEQQNLKWPDCEAMSNDLLARCKEIVSLRTQLSKVGLFPDSELECNIPCVYKDSKIWREFVDTYYNGIDPFIGEQRIEIVIYPPV